MQGDCKQRRAVPDNVLLPRYSDSVVRASHCISFTIRLLTVFEQLNCEREENNIAWKNKDRISAILKGQAAWKEEKIHVAERKEKRKKKQSYWHSKQIFSNWKENFRLQRKNKKNMKFFLCSSNEIIVN